MQMKPVFGLDFGTTNCALSVLDNNQVRLLHIGCNSSNTLRSVILFFEDQILVGEEAVIKYLNNHLVGRFMQSIKTILPTNFGYTKINSDFFSPEDLVSILLKEIKIRGEKCFGQKVDDVVIGRPVIFSENKTKDIMAEKRLRKAAEMAGFKNISFQIEPVAAALTYERTISTKKEKRNILIGDFGGGTSDFSILQVINGKNNVLAVGGIYIAGEIFDSHIMYEKISPFFGRDIKYKSLEGKMLEMPKHIIYELCSRHTMYRLRNSKNREFISQIKNYSDNPSLILNLENLIDKDFGFLIFEEIEKSKKDLTYSISSEINFINEYISIINKISLSEFEKLIIGDVNKIERCLEFTLNKSGLSYGEIDEVFITGGTSQIPLIRKMFEKRFQKDKIKELDAFTSVALGLAESARFIC